MVAAFSIDELITRLGAGISRLSSAQHLGNAPKAPSLSLDWPELDDALPDAGLPRGVVELASPRAIGGGTAIALSAIRAAHAKDARGWCAWIDPEGTLHAPGVAMAGVDLARMLVVRPPRSELARVAVKVASARAFDVIVIDMDPIPGAVSSASQKSGARRVNRKKAWPSEVVVRKLAILAEEGGATVILLTDAQSPRAMPWPVALRLELSRSPDALAIRVAKERQGRVGLVKTISMRSRPLAMLAG